MKKNILLTIFMLALAFCLCFSQTAFAAEGATAFSAGKIQKVVLDTSDAFSSFGTTLTSGSCTNELAAYSASTANGDNVTVYYIAVPVSDLTTKKLPTTGTEFFEYIAGKDGITASAYNSNNVDAFLTVERANAAQSYWYVFCEGDSTKTGDDLMASMSGVVSFCYDLVAPQIDFANYAKTISATVSSADGYACPSFSYVDDSVRKSYLTEDTAKYTLAESSKPLDGYALGDVLDSKLTITGYYLTSSSSPLVEDNWSKMGTDFSFSSIGWFKFRFVIADLAGNDYEFAAERASDAVYAAKGITFGQLEDGNYYFEYTVIVVDTGSPDISVSRTYQNTGIKAGSTFTAPSASLTDPEGSSTSYNYTIYKWIGGSSEEDVAANWQAIYDKTDGIVEGQEDEMSGTKVVTATENEGKGIAVGNYNYMYKVVYTGTDAYGNVATGENADESESENQFVLLIKLIAPTDTGTDPIEVWKIVLICISGAAAVAIVLVIIFVKPKQTAEGGRVHYAKEKDLEESDYVSEDEAEKIVEEEKSDN